MEKIKGNFFVKEYLLKKGIQYAVDHVDQIEDLFNITFLNRETIEVISKQVARGALITMVFNHQSHADAIPISVLANTLTESINREINNDLHSRTDIFPGFILPMAASVTSGDQSKVITDLFEKLEGWFSKHHIDFVPIVRRKDALQYGMNPYDGLHRLANIIKQCKANTGLAIFPEGSVRGGRRIPNTNRRYGMIDVNEPTLLSQLTLRSIEDGKQMLILPVGFSGSYKILDPDKKIPSQSMFTSMFYNWLFFRILPHRYLASVKVGEPFSSEELTVPKFFKSKIPIDIHIDINRQILRRVSRLIPINERGAFSN